MRILWVSAEPALGSHAAGDAAGGPPPGAAVGPHALAARGHDVVAVAPGPLGAGAAQNVPVRPTGPGRLGAAALEARLTAAALRAATRGAPTPTSETTSPRRRGLRRGPSFDVAHVVLHPGSFGVAAALRATGIPVVLEVAAPLTSPGVGRTSPALRRERWRAALRPGAALVVQSAAVARQLEATLGVRGARVLHDGLDLTHLEPLEADAAKRVLGLLPAQRFFALTGPLTDELAWGPLMFAHRRVAGAGLLVAGSGPGEDAVAAMSVATRPSSPVILLEDRPEAQRHAIAAAEVGLAVHPSAPGPAALRYAALGRRVVAFDHPDLDRVDAAFPGESPVVRLPAPDGPPEAGLRSGAAPAEPPPGAAALRTAMETALEVQRVHGPLSPDRLRAFRAELGRGDRTDQLLALYREVTGVDGN